jgi:AraC-like DNA-binding protein
MLVEASDNRVQTTQEDLPVLGQAVGLYFERPVEPLLQRHFVSAWSHHKPAGFPGQTAVVPDAFADLIWFDGRFLASGPDDKAHLESVPPETTVVGVRFQPGAVALWLGVPTSEISGARIPLDCFPANKAQEWIESVADAREPALIARRLEQCPAKLVTKTDSPDASGKLILESIGAAPHPTGPITRNLVSALGTSERTLRRNCEEAFGYGPKTLDRVLRMQRFLALARLRRTPNLAALAADARYADQAHLNREARRLTGLSPKTILSQLSGIALPAHRHSSD